MLVEHSSKFDKKYRDLPPKLKVKVVDRIELLIADEFSPVLKNHPLHGEFAGCRSINITGDIRVIYLKVTETHIRLVAVGTHSQLYE